MLLVKRTLLLFGIDSFVINFQFYLWSWADGVQLFMIGLG